MNLARNMPLDQVGDLKRQIRNLERAVRELRAERRLEAATIGAGGLTVKGGKIALVDPATGETLAVLDADGLTVTGTETVTGNLEVTGTATFGGDTTIGGNAAITGTLSLPNGIIDNDALAEPVVPGVVNAAASNFAVAGGVFNEVAGQDITVPAGFTTLLTTVSGWVYARNPNTTGGADGTGTDALWAMVGAGSSYSDNYTVGISGSNGYNTSTSGFSTLLTGLTPGASIRFSIFAGAAFQTLAANTQNHATVSASLLWLR